VRVALLGPFEARSDAGDRLPVAGARLRDMIARLALAGGRPVSTTALAEAVWGDDPPADLANALRFERLVAAGDVEEALGLWRGPALDDVGEFAAPYALRLAGLRLDATTGWLARELEAGRATAGR
jgi:Bacterial transcriptional activator domain